MKFLFLNSKYNIENNKNSNVNYLKNRLYNFIENTLKVHLKTIY